MKVFAHCTLKGPLTPALLKDVMAHEVPATLKLYLEGKIEQFWFRENAGPIFLLNVESVEEAKAALSKLPMVAQNLATLELIPVAPLRPLGLLIQGK
jgi:muconolactone delta-isomerase